MFKETVKELREGRGLTMAQLAKAIGVTKSRVNMWENNGAVPRQNVLLRLAQFFSVSTDVLLGNRIETLQSACAGVEIPSVGTLSIKEGASEKGIVVKFSPAASFLQHAGQMKMTRKTNAAECEHDVLESLEMQVQKVEAELKVLRGMLHTLCAACSGKDKEEEVAKT